MQTSISARMRCSLGTLVFLAGAALPAAAAAAPQSFAVASRAVTQLALQQSSDFITQPILVFPKDNALLRSGRVSFEWEESKDPYDWPLMYGVTIRQAGVDVRAFQTPETFYTLAESEALPPGTYTWIVVAFNAGRASSSGESRFTIAGADGGIPDAGTASDGGSGGADAGGRDPGVSGPADPHSPVPSSPFSDSSGCTSSPAGGASPGALLPLLALGLTLRATHRHRRVRASSGT